jgi:hypothetical protein
MVANAALSVKTGADHPGVAADQERIALERSDGVMQIRAGRSKQPVEQAVLQ